MLQRKHIKTFECILFVRIAGQKLQLCHDTHFLISQSFAGRKSKSKAKPLVGELYKAWSFGESTSCTDRKQKDEGLLNM